MTWAWLRRSKLARKLGGAPARGRVLGVENRTRCVADSVPAKPGRAQGSASGRGKIPMAREGAFPRKAMISFGITGCRKQSRDQEILVSIRNLA
jgi:hypothetical protein